MSIQTEKLNHVYSEGLPYETVALSDVDLTIEQGSFTALVGHTGSGKSTLAQHFNGLLKPKSGRVLIDGQDIGEKGTDMRAVRRRIGLLFQYPEYQLFEETVSKDVAFGPANLGLSEEEVRRRVKDALELVGLPEEIYGERSPFELSGGQRRRVALAGILAMETDYLVLDEPAAGLDPEGHREILDLVKKLQTEKGVSVVLVSHNMDDVARYADRVLVMDRGRLVLSGAPAEIFSRQAEMEALGLGVPAAAAFMGRLREKGFSVPFALTIEEAEEALITLLKEKKEC